MRVETITTFDALQDLESHWRAVHASDPDAHFYLSWEFMSVWLPLIDDEWLVLLARATSMGPPVAFFPLRMRTRLNRNGILYSDLAMAGNRFADYTGFISQPQHAELAVQAFAGAIKQRRWAIAHFEGLRLADERAAALRAAMAEPAAEILDMAAVDPGSDIDNSICPVLQLPGSFDGYLETLGTSTRQKLRRLLRQLDRGTGLAVSLTTTETLARDLDILFELWRTRWTDVKKERTDTIIANMRSVLELSFAKGSVILPILWHGERAIAANALFVDRPRRAMYFLVGARRDGCAFQSPGQLLHAYAIRQAIEWGYTSYDFLRGNEPYKYAFGASNGHITNFAVRRPPASLPHGALDPLSFPAAMRRAARSLSEGDGEAAASLFKQILACDAGYRPALIGLARAFLAGGRPQQAERVARRLIAEWPQDHSGWIELGRALAMQRQPAAAEAAFVRAVELGGSAAAHHQLALLLNATGQPERARANFDRAALARRDRTDTLKRHGSVNGRHFTPSRP